MNNLEKEHEQTPKNHQQDFVPDDSDIILPEKQEISTQAQALQSNPKTLTGFAKGWVMFMIIAHFAAIGAQLPYIHKPMITMFAVFVSVMIVGFILIYNKKPYGLYITAISNILALIIMNNYFGNAVSVKGSIIFVIITFLVTKKQVKYF